MVPHSPGGGGGGGGCRIQGTDRMPGGRVIFLIAFKLVSGTRFGVGMQIFHFSVSIGY